MLTKVKPHFAFHDTSFLIHFESILIFIPLIFSCLDFSSVLKKKKYYRVPCMLGRCFATELHPQAYRIILNRIVSFLNRDKISPSPVCGSKDQIQCSWVLFSVSISHLKQQMPYVSNNFPWNIQRSFRNLSRHKSLIRQVSSWAIPLCVNVSLA